MSPEIPYTDVISGIQDVLDSSSPKPMTALMQNRQFKFDALGKTLEYLANRNLTGAIIFRFSAELSDFLNDEQDRVTRFHPVQRLGAIFSECSDDNVSKSMCLIPVDVTPDLMSMHGVVLLVGDCHPLMTRDKETLRVLSDMPNVIAVVQVVSCDDPSLVQIRDWLDNLWKGINKPIPLGYLHNPIIERMMCKARSVHEKHWVSDLDTETPEEWIRTNCRK